MVNSANLPAPYGGIDQKTPIAVLKSPYCEELLNFNTTQAGLELRNGDTKYGTMPLGGGVTSHKILGMWKFNDQTIIASDTNLGLKYYTTSSGGITLSGSSAWAGAVGQEMRAFVFQGYLLTMVSVASAFGNSGLADKFNGSAWSAFGYTGILASVNGGCTYRNRAYLVEAALIIPSGAYYYYSGIQAVSGALTSVNMVGVLEDFAHIVILGALTIGDSVNSINLFVIITAPGEVLFYSGAYPDSSDWKLEGRAKISPIICAQPISYNGDLLVLANDGLYSMRSLFVTGSDKISNLTLTSPIQDMWVTLAGGAISPSFGTMGVFWAAKSRIVITFPSYIDEDGATQAGNSFFVYDTLRQSWSVHRSFEFNSSCRSGPIVVDESNNLKIAPLYFFSGATVIIWLKEGTALGARNYQDVTNDGTTRISYDYNMLSAPIPFPKTAVYETSQIEPIMESDLYGETNWNLVADFGRQTSGDQKTDALTTAVAKPGVNVGMQNITYVQVKMSGTTAASKTVGLKLYSYNVWYNAGAEGSR